MSGNRGAFPLCALWNIPAMLRDSQHYSESRNRSAAPNVPAINATTPRTYDSQFAAMQRRTPDSQILRLRVPQSFTDSRHWRTFPRALACFHVAGYASLHGGRRITSARSFYIPTCETRTCPFTFGARSPPAHERRLLSDVLSGCRLGAGLLSHGANMAGFAPLVCSLVCIFCAG